VAPVSRQRASDKGRSTFEVAFDLTAENPGWPPVSVERLWGEKTAVPSEVRLLNVPFFARGVAYRDLIHVRPDHDRRELVFDRLNGESGHSAVRITLLRKGTRGDVEAHLREEGCLWETAARFPSLLAVDVPPEVDYPALREWLKALMADGAAEFQEGAISALHLERLPSLL
jgi:hypothetical protein